MELLLLALLLGGYAVVTRQKSAPGRFTNASYTKPPAQDPQPSDDVPTKVDAPQATVIPAGTDSSTPAESDYYQWSPAVLALKASLSNRPVQIYTFDNNAAFVVEHSLAQTQGQTLDQYEGFDMASFQHSHFASLVDPEAASGVASGELGTCILYIVGASSATAVFACCRYLQALHPGLQIGAP
jgi:hypothetical protein